MSNCDQSKCRRVDESFQERRIAGDDVLVLGTEQLERADHLGGVRADRLEHAEIDERHRDVHAGRPRPQRERVEQHERLVAEGRSRGELKEPSGGGALTRPANPVARLPARPRRLVDDGAARRQSSALAELLDRPPFDVVGLVHRRDVLESRHVEGTVLAQEFLVGGHAPTRVEERGRRARCARSSRASWSRKRARTAPDKRPTTTARRRRAGSTPGRRRDQTTDSRSTMLRSRGARGGSSL